MSDSRYFQNRVFPERMKEASRTLGTGTAPSRNLAQETSPEDGDNRDWMTYVKLRVLPPVKVLLTGSTHRA